ncbi:MAG: hypothetical protein JNM31_04435 [Flavobacteriales bacterium]|nr:hypothetical protein [Flavobacteriales bacterium]
MFAACTGDGPAVESDATEVVQAVDIVRLDQALFQAPVPELRRVSDSLRRTHPGIYRTYIEDILQGAPVDDPRLPVVLSRFVSDPDWRAAQQAADSALGDLAREKALFRTAFARLKAHFPDSLVPRLVAYNAGFNYGIYPADSMLGFGVEWFIGPQHPVIGYLAPEDFPAYVKARMTPAMLVPSAVKGWLLVHYMGDVSGEDLLGHLVATGRVMALLEELLPGVDPSWCFAFTPEQLTWCEANEFMVWKEMVEKEMLFSRKAQDIGRMLNDGPFTNGFPRESPGHIGEWIGYRMVKAYQKAHPGLSYAQLFAIDDPREVLKFYKPR